MVTVAHELGNLLVANCHFIQVHGAICISYGANICDSATAWTCLLAV